MPLSSNDVKRLPSINEFSQNLKRRNGTTDACENESKTTSESPNETIGDNANNNDTNDMTENSDENNSNAEETWRDQWEKLPVVTRYVIIAVSVTLLTSYFLVSFWKFIMLLVLCVIIIFGSWFSQTNLSVEITVFLAKFFEPSSQAIWNTYDFAWTEKFRANHNAIYQEYLDFEKNYNYCPQMDDVYPNGSITNWDRKWPTVTLRAYGLDCKISKYFPKTMALLNDKSNPYLLSHCMYSIIEPDKFIPRHRGPYRGVFRYQLALEVPPTKDPERLYLAVWPGTSSHEFWYPEHVPLGEPDKCFWTVGEDFIFDDTCVHEVRNSTVFRRIILFMDVERHDIPWYSKILHRFFMKIARFLPAIQQVQKVQDKMIDENLKIDPMCEIDSVDEQNFAKIGNPDSMMFLSQAKVPEVAPYKRARILIDKQKKRTQLLKMRVSQVMEQMQHMKQMKQEQNETNKI